MGSQLITPTLAKISRGEHTSPAEASFPFFGWIWPQLLIGGSFVPAASGKTYPVVDPRTEKPVIFAASAEVADVDKAVSAARAAFDEGPWPRMSAKERGRIMYKLADLVERHSEELALLETLVGGQYSGRYSGQYSELACLFCLPPVNPVGSAYGLAFLG